jgi:hypothetical protein
MPANRISFKPEVRLSAGWIAMLSEALDIFARWSPALGEDTMVVTSADDGRHSPTSLHYQGLAFDVRTHPARDSEDVRAGQVLVPGRSGEAAPSKSEAIEWRDHLIEAWVERVKGSLGSSWDVIYEPQFIHIHCEYDPD